MAPVGELEVKRDDDAEEEVEITVERPRRRRVLTESYSFSGVNFLEKYLTSPDFRKMIDSGKYAYVDGRIVLNSPDCLQYHNGKLFLQKCVYNNPAVHCLRMTEMLVRPGLAGSPRPRPGFHRERAYERETTYHHAARITSFNEVTLENVLNFTGGSSEPPWNFGKELIKLMEERHFSEERLAELTGLSEKTIQRMRNSDERPTLRNIVALAVAMSLSLWDSLALIKYAGYELTENREDRLFKAILMCTEENSVYDCNRMLERLHMKPLTKL